MAHKRQTKRSRRIRRTVKGGAAAGGGGNKGSGGNNRKSNKGSGGGGNKGSGGGGNEAPAGSNRKSKKGSGGGREGKNRVSYYHGRVLRPGGGFGSGPLSNPPIGPGGSSGMSGAHIAPPPPLPPPPLPPPPPPPLFGPPRPGFNGVPYPAPYHISAVLENPSYPPPHDPTFQPSSFGGEGWESDGGGLPRRRLAPLRRPPEPYHRARLAHRNTPSPNRSPKNKPKKKNKNS